MNHKNSTIPVAIITIIFSVIGIYTSANTDLKKLDRDLNNLKSNFDRNRIDDLIDFLKVGNVIGYIFNALSIISCIMCFIVVSNDMASNKLSRKFLLPYIIVNSLFILYSLIVAIIIGDTFSGAKTVVTNVVVQAVIGIALRALFVVLIFLHY